METKIKEKINKLIKERLHWDFDVSNVNVYFLDVENSYFNGEEIVIASSLPPLLREINIVHEIMHYLQLNGFALSYDGKDTNEENEWERRHEIDARLFSLLYVLTEFGIEGFNLVKHIAANGITWDNQNLLLAINETKDKELKQLLLNID
jgi:hypothetical protein